MALNSSPHFVSFTIQPDEHIKITTPETTLNITSISLGIVNPMPESGRIVVYMNQFDENGKKVNSVAVAPLTVGTYEVANVDFLLGPFESLGFYTTGLKTPVSVNGYLGTVDELGIEKIN